MNLTIFESYVVNSEMEWEAAQSGMLNISNLIFDSSVLSSYSSSTDSEKIIPKSKVKPLRIVTLDFESVRQERWDLSLPKLHQHCHYTWLWDSSFSVNINKWITSPVYTAYRCDSNDGFGDSIIIAKKNLIFEEIKINQVDPNSWLLSMLSLSTNLSY